MAVVSLATGIRAGSGAATRSGIFGETVVAGEVVYLSASTGKYLKASANVSAAAAAVVGIALNGGADGQPANIITGGVATGLSGLKAGAVYCLANVAGDVCDDYNSDLTEDASYVSVVAVATGATSLLVRPIVSGVVLNFA
jgi:hypothetical protein